MAQDVLIQIPFGVSLETLLPHTLLQTRPEHRWTIAELQKVERQRCSDDKHAVDRAHTCNELQGRDCCRKNRTVMAC